ncbi:MAG: LPD7 domain-containing protein [Campylobacter sp.]|nr:LPD7 domain-containing protein [Campylobacter sp.]MDY4451644.1 LPD7 domain-containing protein [Campylobacter sp.]
MDEFYSDLSTKHDLTPFYFNKELKTLKNKQKGYKIKDSENTLTLTTSKKANLSEQVALMLDMAKSKGWELDSLKVTGSKAFCDEVAKQIPESKAKEKAELAKNRTEKPQKLKAKRK